MATAVARPFPRLLALPRDRPALARALKVLAFGLLVLVSLAVRTRALDTSFWMDEGLSVGIASHPFSAITTVLQQDGSPPLYYLALHVWMRVFGTTETATHAFSLVASMLAIPAGFWGGRSLFGRNAGWACAFLCALNPFFTSYGEETRMYSLVALEGLVAAILLAEVFILRKRGWRLGALALSLAALLYTHGWGLFFVAGAFLVVAGYVWRYVPREERRPLLIDGGITFGVAALLFLPWLPTLLGQAAHTAAPWSQAPRFGAPIQISRGLMGGDRGAIALLLVGGAGIAQIVRGREGQRRPVALLVLAVALATVSLAWIASQVNPAWTTRYFGVVLGALLLLGGGGIARTGRLGVVTLLALTFFWVNPKQFTSQQKSDIKDIAVDVAPQMRPGDLVLSAQPEQVPAIAYYVGPRVRYAAPDRAGIDADPYVMDWRDALDRMKATPVSAVNTLVASLRPGQKVLLVRPFTEGVENWTQPWTKLVRRRSAQWGAVLASDPSLRRVGVAPRIYRGATTVGNSAVLYEKTG